MIQAIPIHTDPWSAAGTVRSANYAPPESDSHGSEPYAPLKLDRVGEPLDPACKTVIERQP